MNNVDKLCAALFLLMTGAVGGCDGGEAESDVAEERAARALSLARAEGPDASLAASFALSGCGLPALCQVTRAGSDAWEATCGTQKISGSDPGKVSPFTLADGRVCSGAIEGGILRGQCTGGDAGSCTYESRSELLPTPYCLELPAKLTHVDVCGSAPAGARAFKATQCEVVQNECSFQARCEGGEVFSGNVTPTGVRWDLTPTYRCVGKLEGGALTGTCTERNVPADAGTPKTCALSAQGELPSQACQQELPKGGFVLKGCGSDGTLCTVAQRGCIWQASCGEHVYRARMSKPGSYEFSLNTGARCTAHVRDGIFSGSCGEGAGACTITSTEPVAPTGCLALPKSGITTLGCGGSMSCDVLQSGCAWQAACATANGTFVYRGSALENGVRFEGQNGFNCWANKEAGSERLVGGCSRTGTEVSECSPRVENGSLVLAPR
jgi:hypothetical protein